MVFPASKEASGAMTGIPVSSGESMVYEARKGDEAIESHVPPHTRDV